MKLEQVLAQWARRMPRPSAELAKRTSPLAGRWTNDHGSVAEIEVDGERISGRYVSAVGASGKTLQGPISGFVRGDIVAFSVLWPSEMRSITSWVGQVVETNGAPELKTLWHLVVDIPDPDEATGLWATIHTGADTFR